MRDIFGEGLGAPSWPPHSIIWLHATIVSTLDLTGYATF